MLFRNIVHGKQLEHNYVKNNNIPLTVNASPALIKDNIITHRMYGFTMPIKSDYLMSHDNQYTIPNCDM